MNKKEQMANAISAWRTLYYTGLINEKESKNIVKKINTKFKKELA